MDKNENVESIIDKISTEIQTVKSHVSDAKYNLKVDNYTEALKHLKEAENTSTCSYCKNKLQEAIFDLEYNKNICSIHSKNCIPNKQQIISKIDEFYDKLPSVEEIRKTKATQSTENIDIVGSFTKSFDEMGKSLGKLWEGMFKF